ncbi:MAG: cupin domain-containing protein [Ignavibacteria bacterium]|nr:cupin domain-containing protein [Ignavibacteria bacterium]
MFYKKEIKNYKNPLNGIQFKPLLYGEKMLMTEFLLKERSVIPVHSHPQDQTGYLVSGKMKLYIEDEMFVVTPRDSWYIPGNVKHNAEILEDSIAIEVFSPVREDYIN